MCFLFLFKIGHLTNIFTFPENQKNDYFFAKNAKNFFKRLKFRGKCKIQKTHGQGLRERSNLQNILGIFH